MTKDLESNAFGEIPCSICGFNEGMPGANMVHICPDCREAMRERTKKDLAIANTSPQQAAIADLAGEKSARKTPWWACVLSWILGYLWKK